MTVDANALIQALDYGKIGQLDAALGGKAPVISITAAKEYLTKGSIDDLRAFLTARGGRIGAAGSEADVAALQQLVSTLKTPYGQTRVLQLKDARVVTSAMKEGLPVITQDKRLIGILDSIGYPHRKWRS